MFVVSPTAIVYDQNGNPVAVSPNVAIPAGTSTILVAGTDGTNARIFSVDSTGKLAVQNPSNLDVALSTRATSAAQTDGSQKTQVVDGLNVLDVNASGQAAIQNPPNLDVASSTLATQATLATLLTEAEFESRINTLGQKTSANSTPVVLASDQPAIPVTDNGGSLTVDNANLDAALSTLATQATVATLLTEAEFEARIGEVQATPTANTVLGRLKDIEDEVVARLGVLGQSTMSGSTPVVIASDQSDVDVAQGTAAALTGAWPVKVTDGTNTLPTGDAAARSVFTQISDGTTGAVAVKPSTTAAQTSDNSLVVGLSPNSPLPAGSNEVGAVAQGTPAALADYWPVRHTDGTNTLPTADVAARALYSKITDGTNTMPTGDVVARSVFQQISDGTTGPVSVKAASTAAQATDLSLVTAFSPNSPLPVGTNEVGAVAQGTPAALADYWPVRHTDGTNTLPTADVEARALFAKVTDGTNTMPTGDAVARSVFHQISDGTTGPVAVKPASTAALAADPSLVTAFSPNSPLPSGTNEVGFVAQGTAAALADYWPVGVTDGTNMLPTADVAARALYAKVTDGTNTQPTGDVAARSIFTQVSDGTNGPVAVKAASTAALAADPSLVTAFSPNSPLPVGTNQIGKIEQGTAAPLAGRWPVQVTDGTNTMPTMDVAARSGYVRVTDGTNTQPTGDVNARAIWTQIGDGTTGPAAVIAGNASPLLTDKSLNVQISPNQDPIPTTVVPATSTPGTAQGKVLIGTAGTYSVVRATTYVEQTTQAQRSIVSSSASDSSAGTGARQVKITYYDATCTGPFYETVTMNGTTAVNTVATDICFIERMDVVSVGSNSYNVGTLSLYTGTGATGTIFATIGVGNLVTGLGDNETLYAHHYVGATTETKVVSVITGVTSSAAGGGRQEAFLKYRNPTVATSPTLLYGDVVTTSQGNALVRPYGAPQTLTGPAVIVGFVIPVANNTTSYFGFDYADEPV